MHPCAVFPLSLVRKALETSSNKMNRIDPKKYNSIVYTPGNLSFVHCGQWPLIATVGVKFRFCHSRQYSGAYVNTKGEAVFAG